MSDNEGFFLSSQK